MFDAYLAVSATLLAVPIAAMAQSTAASQANSKDVSGSQEQGWVLRQDVRRVPVDIVVTDKQGNMVKGLKKDDFIVKEDGAEQQILTFDFEDGTVPAFVPPKLPTLPTNTYVNVPGQAEQGPLYVLYYDMVNTLPQDQATFHQQLLDFVDKAAPGTRIALFGNMAGLKLIQGFTSDHAQLRTAINYQGPGPHLPKVFLYGENYGREDMGAAISNFNFLAEYLGGIPGRKNLLWLSGKFPMPFGPTNPEAAPADMDIVKHCFAALMRSEISVYPVDVKGVILWEERGASPAGDAAADLSAAAGTSSADQGNATQQSTGGLSGASITAIDQQQEDYIAGATGGKAYYGNNAVSTLMEKAVENGESYYTISYSPTNMNFDGSERKIQITLANKGPYTLSYRRLYYAYPEDVIPDVKGKKKKEDVMQARFVQTKAEDTLYANIEHGAPMLHDLLFSTHLAMEGRPEMASAKQMLELQDSPAFFRTRKKDQPLKPLAPVKLQKYRIDYGVIDPQLKTHAKGTPAILEFAAAAYDADGRLLNSVLNEGMPPADAGKDGKPAAFHAQQELEVPPGAASIRVAVRDKATNRTGTLEVPLPLKTEPTTQADKGTV
ncbi:MAG: VWA domain-containing protein [Terracidiphilus sp.]|jgi:VWFA-related protein